MAPVSDCKEIWRDEADFGSVDSPSRRRRYAVRCSIHEYQAAWTNQACCVDGKREAGAQIILLYFQRSFYVVTLLTHS